MTKINNNNSNIKTAAPTNNNINNSKNCSSSHNNMRNNNNIIESELYLIVFSNIVFTILCVVYCFHVC